MQEKISFKAVDPANGKIIGVLLNIKLSPTVSVYWELILFSIINYLKKCIQDGPGPQVEDVSVPETRTILKLFEYLKTNFDLFKRYSDCSTAFEAHMLAVNTTYRGWGIGKALLVHTLDFAKEQGYPICVCVCTSKYSGQLCEALGFDGSYRLAYSDYFVDGKNPITPEAPHTEVVSYVKRL